MKKKKKNSSIHSHAYHIHYFKKSKFTAVRENTSSCNDHLNIAMKGQVNRSKLKNN